MSPDSTARRAASVEHLPSLEVAAAADRASARGRAPASRRSRSETAGSERITQLRSASCRWIGQSKACAQSTIARVVVRVRDRDRRETTPLLDSGDDLVVEQRDAVPQHVAALRRDEQGALADCERGGRSRCRGSPRRRGSPPRAASELLARDPSLALLGHILPRVAGRSGRPRAARRHGGYCVPHATQNQALVTVELSPVRAARPTRRAACAGTCRPGVSSARR